MKVFLVIFTICLLPSAGFAQGNWATFMARYGNNPGSVLVDLSLKDNAPDKRFPFLVATGPRALKCGSNGLPDKAEIEKLEAILSQTDDFLNAITPKVLAGTFTCDCNRANYYYVRDTIGVRTAIHRMYRHGFGKYEYVVNIKYDPEWRAYLTLLYPDEATFNWIENEKGIAAMLEAGDSLRSPRNVYFHISFNNVKDRERLMQFAHTRQYEVDSLTNETGNSYMPYHLVVSKLTTICNDSLDAMSIEIKQEARRIGGLYGGWTAAAK